LTGSRIDPPGRAGFNNYGWRNKRREGRMPERGGEGGEGKVKGRKEEREVKGK
jgi:hypothetical protein